jgi:transcriptional regulator with XRE-family HTH domain
MQRAFTTYVKKLLSERGLKQQDFAALVGTAKSRLNEILNGKTAARPEEMKSWADVLRLDDQQAKTLRTLASLTKSPTEVEIKMIELMRQTGEIPRDDDLGSGAYERPDEPGPPHIVR